jgi:hypothetical protein
MVMDNVRENRKERSTINNTETHATLGSRQRTKINKTLQRKHGYVSFYADILSARSPITDRTFTGPDYE